MEVKIIWGGSTTVVSDPQTIERIRQALFNFDAPAVGKFWKGRPWTPEEDAQVKEMQANGLSIRQISARMNRSGASIHSRLDTIGSQRKRVRKSKRIAGYKKLMGNRPWSEEDIKQLVETMDASPLTEVSKTVMSLAQKLGRTPAAIRGRYDKFVKARQPK